LCLVSTLPSHGTTHLHKNINKMIKRMGLKIKSLYCLTLVRRLYLDKSFTPSATGWSKPDRVTLFGPNRICLNPKILRSNNVTKATEPIPISNKMIFVTNHINTSCYSVIEHILFS